MLRKTRANTGTEFPTKKAATIAVSTLVVVSATGLIAQEAGGLSLTVSVEQALSYSNEKGNTDTTVIEGGQSLTRLGFNLSSATRNQTFSFTGNGDLRYGASVSSGADRFEVEDPRLGLSYGLESRAAAFGLSASYRRSDIDDAAFSVLDTDGTVIEEITGQGERTDSSVNATLRFGEEDGPWRVNLSFGVARKDYSGTTDPDLVDTETLTAGARWTVQLTPTAEAFAFANISQREAAGPGASDRDSTDIGVGGSFEINQSTRATAQLSYSQIETDDNLGSITENDGFNYSLALTRDMPNGAYEYRFSEENTVNGTRRNLSVARSYDLVRGDVNWSIGVSKSDGLDPQPLLGLGANFELSPSSTLALSLQQISSITDQNEESVNTRFNLNYTYDWTELSNLTAGLRVEQRNGKTAGIQDQTSARLSLSHDYELTEDWEIRSSYQYSRIEEDGAADRSSSSVSIGLRRVFSFRP